MLDEKLLLVLGWDRMLCGRCGDGRVELDERIAEAGAPYDPVANGRTEGVSCESPLRASGVLDEWARCAG